LGLFLGVAVVSAGGCQRKPRKLLDGTPPFDEAGAARTAPRWLYEFYAADEAKADKACKGKVLCLDNEFGKGQMEGLWGERAMQVDSAGEKYVAGTVADPKAPSGKREAIRCYIYRPENPLVMEPSREELGQSHRGDYGREDIVGVCVGKVDGAIVLRKCYYHARVEGGPAW
jgi:hypothetical protein